MTDESEEQTEKPQQPTTMHDLMFGDMDDDEDDDVGDNQHIAHYDGDADMDDGIIRVDCEVELKKYLLASGMNIKNSDGKYNNPLSWWEREQPTFPILVQLAVEFLCIPATSAPSERVWSQAARVLTTKRASFDESIASSRYTLCTRECGSAP